MHDRPRGLAQFFIDPFCPRKMLDFVGQADLAVIIPSMNELEFLKCIENAMNSRAGQLELFTNVGRLRSLHSI